MVGSVTLGSVVFGKNVSCMLPVLSGDDAPQPVTLSASVWDATSEVTSNEWTEMLSIFPPFKHTSAPIPVYTDLASQCPYSDCRYLGNHSSLPRDAVVLSSGHLSPAALGTLKDGGTVVMALGAREEQTTTVAASEPTCPPKFPYPWPGSHAANGTEKQSPFYKNICYKNKKGVNGQPCGAWCTFDPRVGSPPPCQTLCQGGAPSTIPHPFEVEGNAFGLSVWNYGPYNTGTVVYSEAAAEVFQSVVSPNTSLLGDWATQIGVGAQAIVLSSGNISVGGLTVTNVTVLVRALDVAFPKALPSGFRSKALLLRLDLAGGGTMLASGLNIMQEIHGAARGDVNAQSAWLLRRLLRYAGRLAPCDTTAIKTDDAPGQYTINTAAHGRAAYAAADNNVALFFDDRWLASRDGLPTQIGTPELLSIYHDRNATNYIGWGYPSVFQTASGLWRMVYQADISSCPQKVLMAESDDAIHWKPATVEPRGSHTGVEKRCWSTESNLLFW
jgi:hypothetical protein